jgi:glycosyltransferase involved in cell wall biosynthesis
MRIALFSEVFPPKIDGITNRLDHTLRCLRGEGHEVLVFAPEGSPPEHAGARVIAVPGAPLPLHEGLRISAPDPRILLELWRFGPHVVHAVGPACLGVWGIAAARALRLPIVASYHTDLPRYLPGYGLGWLEPAIWPLLARVHRAAHVNLAPSHFTRRELIEHGVAPVGVWRGAVDSARFHPRHASLAMRLRLSGHVPDGPLLVYAGRLSPEKRLDTFGEILAALPEARLALVGDGPARRALERMLPADRTIFTGFLRGDELAAAFASADVFVMPSTTETLGFVVLEAMASGCAVVAAGAGGIPDLVEHGESGLLYDPGDPRAAIDAIASLLRQPGRRRFLAMHARKRAEESSWLAETRKLVDEYRKAVVLASHRGLARRLCRAFVGW